MTFYSISCSSFNLFRYTYINPSHSYGTAVGTAYCSTVPFLLLLIIIRFRIKVPGPTCNFAAFPPTACNFNGYTVYHQGPATQIDINRRQAARTGGEGGRAVSDLRRVTTAATVWALYARRTFLKNVFTDRSKPTSKTWRFITILTIFVRVFPLLSRARFRGGGSSLQNTENETSKITEGKPLRTAGVTGDLYPINNFILLVKIF